ncbi:unnamed protein product [Fusarium graminearum]|uniref:Chromosome 4, complete genome n=1 Tax=Gibberella zeae (strain ATCC MYA-4620 / CBS 123657 / FGSC 9075 / NRRL 31084 / PH-1) TaxID=229533 RepID=A0A098DQL1_GIBZE|nr:unnamed protein product [Fusarium graminearum]CZS72389.1 unnamed protein product [Fusarium graminearum]
MLLYNLNKSPLIQISSRQSIVEVIMAATNNPSADINLSKDDPKPKPPWPTDPMLRSCGEARRKSVRIGERNKENRNAYASGSNLENGRVA